MGKPQMIKIVFFVFFFKSFYHYLYNGCVYAWVCKNKNAKNKKKKKNAQDWYLHWLLVGQWIWSTFVQSKAKITTSGTIRFITRKKRILEHAV